MGTDVGTGDSGSKVPQASPAKDETPLMRALGQFFGEVWKGVKSDPRSGAAGDQAGDQAVTKSRQRVEEREVETEQGRVILRRTTIEEIIVPDEKAPRERDR